MTRWKLERLQDLLQGQGYIISTDGKHVGFADRPRYAVLGGGELKRFGSLQEIADYYRISQTQQEEPHA